MAHAQVPYLGDSLEPMDPLVRKATVFMEKNVHSILNTDKVDREVGLSNRQLKRLFITSLRDSPMGYFRKLRLRRAHWLSRHTALPITEIALECGFTDSSHLAMRCKEFFGYQPSQTRNDGYALKPPLPNPQKRDWA
jgi:transcriptional regulator GlxA family with amidase domain